jgi:hypothetical protein
VRVEALQPTNAYITEAVIKIQTVDIIIPPSVLANYMQFFTPFLNKKSPQKNDDIGEKNISTPFIGITNLRNESLPLIYLEFKGFRLMLPVASQSIQHLQHDLLMLKVYLLLLILCSKISRNSTFPKKIFAHTFLMRHLHIQAEYLPIVRTI